MRLRLFARAQAATSGADVSFSIWEGATATPRSVWNTSSAMTQLCVRIRLFWRSEISSQRATDADESERRFGLGFGSESTRPNTPYKLNTTKGGTDSVLNRVLGWAQQDVTKIGSLTVSSFRMATTTSH